MRSDLLGLLITKGEVKRLSGVGLNDVFKPPTLGKYFAEFSKSSLLISLLFLSCVILSISLQGYEYYLVAGHLLLAIAILYLDFRKMAFSTKNKNLIKLFEDVEKYNSIILSLDINDQIEAAGNPSVQLQNRDRVIEALELTRADLVRALKTERILRENQQFITRNPELFSNNLESLAALQVSDRASEYGRILNEAMQLAIGIREEMRKLQDTSHPSH